MGVRRSKETEEQPTAAEQNPVTDDAGHLPEQTDPTAEPTTTPTDPETAQAVADATAADAAETQPDQPEAPTDVAAGSDGGPKIEGPSPASEGEDVGSPALSSRDHAKGCPAERLEAYPARRPDGTTVKVSHCIDCGASVIDEL